MRNNNFTEKQLRGLDLVFKSVKKKFPFVLGWEYSDGWEKYDSTLYLDLIIDIKKLGEFVGMEKEYERTSKFGALLAPFNWGNYGTEDWEKTGDKSYQLSKQIKTMMNDNYEMLPEDYKIYWKLGQDSKYLVNLSYDNFIPR